MKKTINFILLCVTIMYILNIVLIINFNNKLKVLEEEYIGLINEVNNSYIETQDYITKIENLLIENSK